MPKPVVLVFHQEKDGALFEKIILALRARYTLVSLAELEGLLLQKKDLRNTCHISFDDGEISFYNIVFPVLQKHQVPVSLFVSPGVISSGANYWFQEIAGYDERVMKNILAKQLQTPVEAISRFALPAILKCLPAAKIEAAIHAYRQETNCGIKPPQNIGVEELRKLDASGLVTIGAHTINHPVLQNEADEGSYFEITESVKQLGTLLGHPVTAFAYPNGRPGIDFGEREIKCLRDNKVSLAFTTASDHLHADTDPLQIPRMSFARMGLSPSNPLVSFRLNVGSKWIDIKSIGKPTEAATRAKIKAVLAI